MHQDIFRNAVHRSLSKSLNSRGVNSSSSSNSVEASTNGKIKEKSEKVKERGIEESVKAMARSNFTELQVRKPRGGEIRKGCGTDFEMLSKNLAETLLKGAMDLQVSIDMLESFQKNVNRRRKGPGKGDEAEGWFAQDINANRYVSDGASSNNSIDRLKKVISESLYKQNLIMVSSDDEKSSSNQSNSDNSNNSKSPGIVAKLMGIRETPKDAERFQPTNWDAKVKSLSSLRAVFDLERMPRVRKEKPTHEKINPNRKALLDIMETMQFKGLMRIKQGDNEATAFSVRGDQSTKSMRRVNEKMPCTKVAKGEMRTFKEDKIENCKIVEVGNVKGKGVDRRAAGSAQKNEKKTIANSITSKSMQKNKKIVPRTSNASTSQVTKPTQHNSTLTTRQKTVAVPTKSGSSNMTQLVERKTKKEGKGFKTKIQRNSGMTDIHARHPESNHKPKRPDPALSVEDNRANWSVMYEALVDSNSAKSQEKQGTESISFSGRSESDIRLLLLSNKSFTAFAKFNLKLCLDIAIEQVSRKNTQYSFLYPSYHVSTLARRPYFCIEKLVAETTHGIRKLTDNYQNQMKRDDLKDVLYVKLERDLQCSDLGINSIWNSGWSDWICVEEAGIVVCDITDHVLSFLIEEISLDPYAF